MKRVLLSLLVIAGVLYAGHAVFSGNSAKPANDASAPPGKGTQAPEAAQALSVEAMAPSPAGSRHAIEVEQAPSRALAENSPAGSEATASPAASGEAAAGAQANQPPFMKVTSPATIREGPSTSAAIIGIARPGAEARVLSRSADWVEIIDPGSQKTGWIHESFMAPQAEPASHPASSEEVDAALATSPESDSPADDQLVRSNPHRHASRHRHYRHGIVLGRIYLRLW